MDIRIDIGQVIAHPENTICGFRLPENRGYINNDYFLDGLSTQIGIQKRYFITNFVYLKAEGKLNYTYSKHPVVNGYAIMQLFVAHILLGLGLKI